MKTWAPEFCDEGQHPISADKVGARLPDGTVICAACMNKRLESKQRRVVGPDQILNREVR